MAKLFGQLEKAQIENLTADPTGVELVPGRIWFRTDTEKLKAYDGTVIREFADLDSAQTFTNKSLTSPVITGDTTYNEVAVTPATPGAGQAKFYLKGDGLFYKLDPEGNEVPVGSGSGGGLGVYHTEDFEINDSGDFVSGNNASFLGGGILQGTLENETTSPLNGSRSLKYTQAAGSLNDYFASPVFEVPLKARGNKTGARFVFSNTGDNGDFKPEVYDVTNGETLVLDAVSLPSKLSADKFEVFVNIPLSCTQIRWGAQVKVENIGSVLTLDDIEFDANALAPAEYYASTGVANYSPTYSSGLGTVSNSVMKGWREGEFFVFSAFVTVGTVTSGLSFFELPNGLLLDSTKTNGTGQRESLGWWSRVNAGANFTDATYSGPLTRDSNQNRIYFSFRANSDVELDIAPGTSLVSPGDSLTFRGKVPIQGWDSVERGVSLRGFENLNNENEFSARIDGTDPFAAIISQSSDWIESTSRPTTGRVQIDFKTGLFTEPPAVVAMVYGRDGRETTLAGIPTATGVLVNTTDGGVQENNQFSIKVTKQGADFVKEQERTVILPSGLQNPVCYLRHEEASGTNGGSIPANTDLTSKLNVIEQHGTNFASLALNRFTLPAGEYEFDGYTTAIDGVAGFTGWIHNITTNQEVLSGSTGYSSTTASSPDQVESFIKGILTVNQTTEFELRHRAPFSGVVGLAANRGPNEVYEQLKITKRA